MAKDKNKKIVRLDRSVREISAEELREYWGHLKIKADIMRNIILNEKDFCNCKYHRSQRDFWYKTVKPTLEKLNLLSPENNTEDEMSDWDSLLSKYLAEYVKEGVMTYQDIMILDESRNYDVPQFGFHPYSNIIVAVEKDTVYRIIRDIADLLKCSYLSCKGQVSLGSVEQIIRGVEYCSRHEDHPYEEIILLTLTDYDPTGYSIADSLHNNIRIMMDNLGLSDLRLVSKRIGLVPNQLTEQELRNNMYTPKRGKISDKTAKPDSTRVKFNQWMKRTGGIYLDGEHLEKGLELDSLEPEQIRKIFAEELKKYIDPAIYKEYVKECYLDSMIRDAINKHTDTIKEKLKNQFISQVDCSDIDINKHILNGDYFIPSGDYCHVDGVDEAVAKVFSNLDFTA